MLTILLLVNLCVDADVFIFKLPCPLESLELHQVRKYDAGCLWEHEVGGLWDGV